MSMNKNVLVGKKWTLARSIDFHERNPWAVIWAAISPFDELFVYREWTVDLKKWINKTIAEEIAKRSGFEVYRCNLIDPKARTPQTNTGRTTIDDLNDYFLDLKRDGVGTGGFWETFNTKDTVGRDDIRRRLRNSVTVERPFNNRSFEKGHELYLPTIWVLRNCPETARSLRSWRYEEWGSSKALVSKDRKEEPAQKFSHFCTALEGLLKDRRFRARKKMAKRVHDRPKFFKHED